jgi:hypothetical protein
VAAQSPVATQNLDAPSAPVCSASVTDSTAPGSISIGGGDQVKLGSGGGVYGPRAYSGLGAGTYTGYARNVASDGYNTAYSGWDACAAKTILGPPATPSSSTFNFSQQRYCSPTVGLSVVASWSAVAGATSYDVRMQYEQSSNLTYTPWDTHTVTATGTGWDAFDSLAMYGTATVQVRANNAAGSSAWSSTQTASPVGGCQAG